MTNIIFKLRHVLFSTGEVTFSSTFEFWIPGINLKIKGKPAVILNITKSIGVVHTFLLFFSLFMLYIEYLMPLLLVASFVYICSWIAVKKIEKSSSQKHQANFSGNKEEKSLTPKLSPSRGKKVKKQTSREPAIISIQISSKAFS